MTRMAAVQRRPGTTGFRRALLAFGIFVIACGAGVTQPTAPFGQGVSLYPDSLYRGKGVTIDGDVANLFDLRGPCGDAENAPTHYDDCDRRRASRRAGQPPSIAIGSSAVPRRPTRATSRISTLLKDRAGRDSTTAFHPFACVHTVTGPSRRFNRLRDPVAQRLST